MQIVIDVKFSSSQEYISLLMPPLIEKWNILKDTDKDLFPLLEVYVVCKPLFENACRQLILCTCTTFSINQF